MQSVKWPVVTFRVFGVANLLLAGICACFTFIEVISVAASNSRNPSDLPYFLQAFIAMVAINLTFEIMLAVAGIRLWQTRREGLTICNVLFPLELAYFLIVAFLWSVGSPKGLNISVGGATGIANVPLVVQWITGYPIIALVVLNIVGRRLRSSTAFHSPEPSTS
jgi:hypothetical protein